MSGNRRTTLRIRPPRVGLVRLAPWSALGLLVAGLMAGGLFWFLRDHSYFHVVMLRTYGTERVTQQEVSQLAQIGHGVSLLRIDVDVVRARVMRHPWIRDVLVRRVYPNELELLVYERKPVATLERGRSYLIDAEGYVLGEANARERSALPRVEGKGAQPLTPGQRITDPGLKTGLGMLARMQLHPAFRDTGITRVDIASAERLVLQTRMGKLVVGPSVGSLEEKYSLLPTIGDIVRKYAQGVESIDLTYTDQIVVKATRATQGPGRLQKRERGGGQAQ